MAQLNGNSHMTADPRGAELPPAYDSRCAFAWTLRSAEIARREGEKQHRQPNRSNRRRAPMRVLLARV